MRTTRRSYRIGSAALALTAGLGLSCTSATGALAQMEMKIGFITINDSQHETAKWFTEEIAKRTNGAVQGRIFPAGQLGSIQRQIEGIQIGTQEIFLSPPGFFVGINPAFAAPDAPGMFESVWHQHVALNHPIVRDKFLALADQANIVGASIWAAGKTTIATRTPVKTLDDLKGMKLRVLATKTEIGFVKAIGATGVPMDFSETLAAIQNRTLDGARTVVLVLGPSKFYTAAKYLYNEGTGIIPQGMWLSKSWLAKLPADQRQAIFDVAKSLTDKSGLVALEISNRWEKLWIENGGEITEPSNADRAEIARRIAGLADEALGSDPKIKDMYLLLKQAADATKGAKPPAQ
jgi:TRAP-type C4-dicarboxylate transport system substrate-binding protein